MLQPHSLTVVKFHGEGAGRDATRWERGAGLQRAAQPGTSTAGSTEHSDPRQLQEGGGRGELQQHSVMTRSTMRPAVPLTAPNRALCMSVQEVFDYNSIHLLCCLLDHGGLRVWLPAAAWDLAWADSLPFFTCGSLAVLIQGREAGWLRGAGMQQQ